jgi:hypothetical protein
VPTKRQAAPQNLGKLPEHEQATGFGKKQEIVTPAESHDSFVEISK